MNLLGYERLGEGDAKAAIEVFTMNVQAYPASPNVYDSLADAFLADGNREMALKYTEKAQEVLNAAPNVNPDFRKLLQQSIDAKLKQLRPAGGAGANPPESQPTTAAARQPAPMPPIGEIFAKPIVLSVAGMEKIQPRADIVYKTVDTPQGKLDLKLDAYIPDGAKSAQRFPAVILVSGGGTGTGGPQGDYDWRKAGVYQSYGKLLAASGFVGIPFMKRYSREQNGLAEGEADTLDAVSYVRAHNAELNVDPDRIAVWAFSGGGWMLSPFLRSRPSYLRALVAFYAVLDVPNDPDISDARRQQIAQYSPVSYVPFERSGCCAPPIFVAKAGLDNPALNEGIDRFLAEARKRENYIQLEFQDHTEGRHGFDILDDNDRSRDIIRSALAFLKKNLSPTTTGM
jgi:acetyl esterase/lipase